MTIASLDREVLAAETEVAQRRLLHVGCGAAHPDKVPAMFFARGEWAETRLDIDPDVAPDVLASITDMGAVPSDSFDGVWSAHNLEHLAAHEVGRALGEFLRVLKPGGFAAMTMPDLQQVAHLVAEDRLEETAYESTMGPVAPLDMLYGFRPAIDRRQRLHGASHRFHRDNAGAASPGGGVRRRTCDARWTLRAVGDGDQGALTRPASIRARAGSR